jgi:3-methyladenine DNA glycosylase AlkD
MRSSEKKIQSEYTADQFINKLKAYKSDDELGKYQHFFIFNKDKQNGDDFFIGVKMGQVFKLAKEFEAMQPDEIEKLLESPVHEVRVGAVSIMDFQARNKKTPETRRKELFDLYIKRHYRINNWDLVDRSAIYVIGSFLFDKPRNILYKLAKSKNIWERRTAIVSTAYFIKQGEADDTFKIAEILINDKEDLIHKAVGGWIRQAGKIDKQRLMDILEKYAATMPRTTLRYAVEHLNKKQRDYYMNMKNI